MDCTKPQSSPLWNGRNGDTELEDITSLSLKNFVWRYRGEGNANLVIALPREKIILRMQKCDYNAVLEPATVQEWEIKLKKSVVFYKKVMVPLLGTDFILPPDLARISDEEIKDIDRILLKVRPTFRLNKGLRLGLVTVQPDYTLLPPRVFLNHNTSYIPQNNEEFSTFCVEIKPKQGWVPLADRHPKCTFCLKQYLKLQKKRTTSISKYCPLDLFSGDRQRMRLALENLLETPQNNLKIFHSGNILYGEGSSTELGEVLEMFFGMKNQGNARSTVDRWCQLVLDALTREFDSKEQPVIYYDGEKQVFISAAAATLGLVDRPCDWSSLPLPQKCILQRVLSVQKLQTSDFKSIYSQYKEQSSENYSYVNELFCLNNPLDDVQRYLLSATAKDCSIFIAFQRTKTIFNENSSAHIKDSEGVSYQLNIGISDIDPKPLSCIGKHHKRDEELLAAALLHDNSDN